MTAAAAPAATRPVISAWSAVSPYGLGAQALVDGLRSGRSTAAPVDTARWGVPEGPAHLVPGFETRQVLGKKGTRSMDRVTGLAVSVVGGLLDQPEADRERETGERAALVLGTTTGSAESMMDFTRTSLLGEAPFDVDPAVMPNAVMNCAAGQCSIWYGIRGPNTTLAQGRTAGLAALHYSTRLLSSGRAGSVLCTAAEEFSRARYWLERHSRAAEAGDAGYDAEVALGEGAAALLVQRPDTLSPARPALAEVLAVRTRVATGDRVRPVLEACVASALEAAGARPHDVWAASPGDAPGRLGACERQALTALFGTEAVERVPGVGRLGDVSAASATFQIAFLLATAALSDEAAGRLAVITSADRDGSLACAVLRLVAP
ncbi:beta-ketoacyl synthase N-terminal-like domain-containing protein [Streptomyces sp. S465]|uniref:beta-ketoacyl synthase N-terminal-like domain-containing protein n=1 Tax=Streptomyces sp. S465 TaxID=2979468 RepID=UPI0022A82F9E|nr:beta-ketoacyl synthase N-terminal-like domain-containing protein [Streptomyces sp. S465]WAP56744.1 beta-ketoacyl synthase N-terminal-like domain-containing protein [Streptomyces sp. S465]